MKVLLIGGSNDGKRVSIPAGHVGLWQMIRVPTPPQSPGNLLAERDQYEPMEIRAGGEFFTIYKISGMSDAQVMFFLIENYCGEIQKRETSQH